MIREQMYYIAGLKQRGDMKSAIKIPLQVTPEQAVLLDAQSKIANWLYNKLLETANDLRKQYRAAPDQERRNQIGLVLYTERGLRNLIPGLKRAMRMPHAMA